MSRELITLLKTVGVLLVACGGIFWSIFALLFYLACWL